MPGPQPEGTAPLTGHVPFRSQVHSLEKLTLLSESTGSALWETLCLSLFSSSGSRVSFRDPVPGGGLSGFPQLLLSSWWPPQQRGHSGMGIAPLGRQCFCPK